MPIVGSLNYFHNGQGDGTIVLVLAVISMILAITRRFRGLSVTGLCSDWSPVVRAGQLPDSNVTIA